MRRILYWMWLTALAALAANAQHYPILPISGSPRGISALLQDSRSAIWIGTVDDVVCFDGTQFYSLRKYGFPKEKVESLAEDSDGGIWIATSGSDVHGETGEGGMYRYQQGRLEKLFSGDVFSVVTIAPGVMLSQSHKAIKDTYGDLYLFRKANKSWHSEKITERSAIRLTVDRRGTALFPCPGGWCEFTSQQLENWPDSGVRPRFFPLPDFFVPTRVLRDRFNCLWYRNETTARYKCPTDDVVKTVPDSIANIDTAHYLGETADGSIVLLGGIAVGRPDAFHVVRDQVTLPKFIHTALIAKDGTILLGAEDGLFRFMYPFTLEYWDQRNGFIGGLSVLHTDNHVFGAGGGITTLSADRAKWSYLVPPEVLPNTVHIISGPGNTILSVSLSRGVTQLGLDGKILATSKEPGGARLTRDSLGQTWKAGLGIGRVARKDHHFEFLPEVLLHGTALDMEYDGVSKTLWACLGNEVVGLRRTEWLHISQRDGLLNNYCRSVTSLPNGDVWMAYGEFSAISRIQSAFSGKPSIRTFMSGGEVGDAHSTFLDRDNRGWLWRASEHEIYLATPDSAEHSEWLRLDRQDGIPEPGGDQNSFYNDPDGSVWFTNNGTVVHFKPPEGFVSRFPSPAVFVSGFSIGPNDPTFADTVPLIPHGENVVAHVGTGQFDRRNALHIRYRLLPGDREWKGTDSFTLPLLKLMPGKHVLEIQGRFFTGDWSEITHTSFTVLWPFWLSWPALLLYSAGATGLSLGVSAWRRRQRFTRDVILPDISAWRMGALSPETEHLIGTVIADRYEVGHILSIGGFATVARARDLLDDGKLCAIKIFRYGLTDGAWIRHRFDQEVAALEQLSHPNIVKITGHGDVATGAPYLVMEFVHGTNLRNLLLENGPLSRKQTGNFLSQMASALEALHQRLIFHRDLKPENLMIRPDSDNGQQIVLIDFSIALVKSPEQTFHGISRVAGSLDYMAPEQLTGYADSSTDIHSLAKVVIEMLSGSRWSELLEWATLDMPGQVRLYFATNSHGLSVESVENMASALAFDPGLRPKDAGEFAAPIVRDLANDPQEEVS